MKNRKTLLIVVAVLCIVTAIALWLSTDRDKAPADNVSLSANLALLDLEEVPDYALDVEDSLLRFETSVANLGRMRIGDRKEFGFRFRNVSTAPVVITKIVTTCGCTSPEYAKKPLMPEEESVIKVAFEPDETGVFFKKLFIYYAGGGSPLEIAIKGEVR